jgi:hypothetical protein
VQALQGTRGAARRPLHPEIGMKVAALQKSATETPNLFEGGEPVLVTRQGKISGLYVPLEDPDQVPLWSNSRNPRCTRAGLWGVLHAAGILQAGRFRQGRHTSA